MDELALQLANQTIKDYLDYRQKKQENQFTISSVITQVYQKQHKNSQKNFIITANNIVSKVQVIYNKSAIRNKETSCDFNIMSFFHLDEKKHSSILAFLLDPNGNHGQKHLFLNLFLDLLKIKRLRDNENWIITTEKSKIDVLLKRFHPHSVVIIENKSNYANDQNNQLYRYWYQEIYRTISEKHLPKEYIYKPPEEYYQLIYLSPEHWKKPSTNTLTKPNGWNNDLPKEVPLKAKHLLFRDFICNWLKISLELLPKENQRIREFIKQYIEYWS